MVNFCAIARGLPSYFDEAPSNNVSATIAELLIPFDEDLFLRKALQHKVISTLYMGLTCTSVRLSQPGMKKLQQLMTFDQAARSFLLLEWQNIDAACKRHGIPVMTIKGPAASLQLYRDALLREYTDLDMVVLMQDIYDMVPIMEEIGYTIARRHHHSAPNAQTGGLKKPAAGDQSVKPPWLRRDSRFILRPGPPSHVVFSQKTSPFRVEIHNKVFNDGSGTHGMSLPQVMARCAGVVHNGHEFNTLSLADHAVFMLQHGAKHNWGLLHWVLDAAVILNRCDRELHQEMAQKIRGLRWERQLALIMGIVRKLFPIDVPEPFRALISPYLKSVSTPVCVALDRLQQAEDSRHLLKVASILRFLCGYQLPLAQGGREKIKVLMQHWVVQPADAKILPLPEILQPLYLLLRPFFMLFHRINGTLARRKKACLLQN